MISILSVKICLNCTLAYDPVGDPRRPRRRGPGSERKPIPDVWRRERVRRGIDGVKMGGEGKRSAVELLEEGADAQGRVA